MTASVVQQDSAEATSSETSWTQTFFESGYGMKNVMAGHALVVLFAGVVANTVASITDNYGNTYVQVPGAAINDANTGRASDVWWAQNVAQVTDPGKTFALTINLNGTASNNWGAVIFEVSGINGATIVAATASIDDTNDSTFSGPSLNGGSGAFYVTGLAGIFGDTATVALPWAIVQTPGISNGGGGSTESNGGQSCAALVSSGTQQAVFTPQTASPNWFIGAISGVAFIPASGFGSTSIFLGSVRQVSGIPSGQPDVFLGSVKVIGSAPAGANNPYLGHINVVASPDAGRSNPTLGEVVIVESAPSEPPDPWLGTIVTE
jgi:hypothetical protein